MGSALWKRATAFAVAVCASAALAAGGQAAEPFDTRLTDWVIEYDTATFWFDSIPAGIEKMTFECRYDGGLKWTPCTSPVKRTGLAPGEHSIEIRGVAADGTVDETPANLTWNATTPPPPPPPPGPENDHWRSATLISGSSGAVAGTTVNATRQWDEPYNPLGAGHSVWYAWTATRDATVTFSAASADFAPVVAAYGDGGSTEFRSPIVSGKGSASFRTSTGITYKVAVDGDPTGPFRLAWAYEELGPANDFFERAQTLVGPEGAAFADNRGATIEWNEVRHDGDPYDAGGNSVWFRWVAPATGPYVLWTEGSSFDTSLRPYRATTAHDGTALGYLFRDANPWSADARVQGRATKGDVLYVSLDGEDASTGTTTLRWRQTVASADATSPWVALRTPSPGEYVSGSLTLTAEASDDVGVDRVEYWLAPYDTSGDDWYVGTALKPAYEVTLKTDVLAPGRYDIRATAFDASGNQMSSIVTVWIDVTPPPTLILPRDVRAEATSAAGAVVKYTATARDWAGRSVPVTCKPPSGSTFPLRTTVVTCSATDARGSTVTRSFRVTVADTTPPELRLPSLVEADATSPAGASVSFAATAFDRVSGDVAVTCDPAPDAAFAIGDTTVSCRAADARGNAAAGTFLVHVRGALEQVRRLRAELVAYPKLQEQLGDVERHLAADRLRGACGGVKDVAERLEKDPGTEEWRAAAHRIRAVLAC